MMVMMRGMHVRRLVRVVGRVRRRAAARAARVPAAAASAARAWHAHSDPRTHAHIQHYHDTNISW